METIQVVLDAKLLRMTNKAAQKTKQNRSALIRDAIRAYVRNLEVRALEEQDRAAYKRIPQDASEIAAWERVSFWPAE
jgi:metal-responsive CopG/Arc/MetJ family transcriptional regulator